ncbi:TPM domain-containing protein [Halobacteriovorax sp.]|uniref:TPM domain-containing protein n=1 Tax=Halobacteriovorax sp. TaxID=2020862 RepID=UPI003565FA16
MNLTNKDKEFIKNVIRETELKTSGEIVPVILSKSDFYPAAHFRLALFFGLLVGVLTYNYYDFDDPIVIIWAQIPGMILGYLLAYIPLLKRFASTANELQEEVYQRALEVFHESNVSKTKDRTGIMIFISLLEKRVEVMADIGISSKLPKDYWQDIVSKLIVNIRLGQTVKGLSESISECGGKLVEYFPIEHDDENEICDELITDL